MANIAMPLHCRYDESMIKRTTIEIDEQLLDRAERALGTRTMRATVEEALRRAVESAEPEFETRAERQWTYYANLHKHAELDVLASEEMWR